MPINERTPAAFAAIAAIVLSALPVSVSAQMDDGRSGPVTMTGTALNDALANFNTYLQARYEQDDMLAQLDAAPAQDFVNTAIATAQTPLERTPTEDGAFGVLVGDGQSLMAHLVAFEEERTQRGDDLFIRIARAEASKLPSMEAVAREASKLPSMEAVARDVYAGDGLSQIRDDPTLNAEMAALNAGLKSFEAREAQLSQAVPAVTGESFETFGKALDLLF